MNEKLLSHIECVIADNDCLQDIMGLRLPESKATCDSNDIQEALNTVLTWQKQKRVLVATSSNAFANLLLAMNQTLPKHKIAILCNGVLYDDDAMAEIEREEKMLHTVSGTEYFPVRQLSDALFVDENGHLLLRGSEEGKNQLYASDGTAWGCSLDPSKYTSERLVGELMNHLEDFNLKTKACICKQVLDMFEHGGLPADEGLLVFKSDMGVELLRIGSPIEYDFKSFAAFLYAIIFAHNPGTYKDKLEMLISDRLAHMDYPAYMFEDFVSVYAKFIFPSMSCAAPGIEMFRNTLDRILITEKEES